jgi:hypothetical protein
VVGIAAVPLTAVALWYFGYAEGIVEYLIPVAVAVVLTVGIAPVVELGWNWLQAPMRLLTEDVVAIRAQLERVPGAPEPSRSVGARVALFNLHHRGLSLLDDPVLRGSIIEEFTERVAGALAQQVSDEAAEEFLRASDEAGRVGLALRLEALEAIAERQPQDPR